MMARSTSFALLGLGILLAVGCGDGRIARAPVSGQVLMDGQPYEGAWVIFCPLDGSDAFKKERPAGVTDESGRYELTTFDKDDGAPPGEYQVTIRNTPPKSAEQARRFSKQKRIDRRYAKPDTTDLTATIPAEGGEIEPFNVEPAAGGRRR